MPPRTPATPPFQDDTSKTLPERDAAFKAEIAAVKAKADQALAQQQKTEAKLLKIQMDILALNRAENELNSQYYTLWSQVNANRTAELNAREEELRKAEEKAKSGMK